MHSINAALAAVLLALSLTLCTSAAAAQTAEQAFADGQKIFDHVVSYNQDDEYSQMGGDVDTAIADFNRAIELSPNSIDFYFARGLTYALRSNGVDRDSGKAIDDFEHVLQARTNDARGMVALAFVYAIRSDYVKSDALFQQGFALGASDRDFLEFSDDINDLVGDSSYDSRPGHVARKLFLATEYINQATRNPKWGWQIDDAYRDRSNSYALEFDFEHALADANMAVFANLNAAKGTPDPTIAELQRQVDETLHIHEGGLDVVAQGLLEHRAHIRDLMKSYGAAIDDYTLVLPNNIRATFIFEKRALDFALEGDYAHAMADMSSAAQRLPPGSYGEIDGFADRCLIRALTKNELAAGLADCNASIAKGSVAKPAYRNDHRNYALEGTIYRAFMNLQMGDYSAALKDASDAYSDDPKYGARALYLRGVAKEKMGDISSGQADVSTALAMSRNAADILYGDRDTDSE
jgi:tetratricopeptide (TPR) repeat protein